HDSLIETVDQARASIGDQPNIPRLTRLKADSRSCRNIQSKPQGGLSIKIEGRVSLREMIVAANLDWPIAGICNFEGIAAQASLRTISPAAEKISPGII